MQKAAIAIMAEDAGTANHTERVAYAKEILDGTASTKEFSYGVVTNATIQTKIDQAENFDSDLDFVVSSIFNAFAGIAAV